MLGVSFSELFIVFLVAFFVMKPHDIRKLAYWYKYALRKIGEIKSIAEESVNEINKSLSTNNKRKKTKQEYAIDLDGKLHKIVDTNREQSNR